MFQPVFLNLAPYFLSSCSLWVCDILWCTSLFHAADVQFWRSRKTLEGLSVRSVFFNVFQSFIVLLYILDNETNYVIIISVFVGRCGLESG